MRILIIGASRGTGALATGIALERGHDVTAFSRHPSGLAIQHPKLARIAGDFHDPAAVAAAVRGHEAVIITASAPSIREFRNHPNYFSQGTRYVIDAMKAHAVRRLVLLSALGTGDSLPLWGFLMRKLFIAGLAKIPFQDHERQEQMARESGLEWVVVRPGRLTDGPARKRIVKTTAIEPVPRSISRADVANVLVEAAETDSWVNRAVQIGG